MVIVHEAKPTLLTLGISEVRRRFASVLNGVSRGESRVVVVRSGVPVAAIVSPDDLARLDRLDEQDRRAEDVLERMRAPFRDVPPEEIEREAERAIAAVRARRRAERERASKAVASA
jgi:prevent-host-death family protein